MRVFLAPRAGSCGLRAAAIPRYSAPPQFIRHTHKRNNTNSARLITKDDSLLFPPSTTLPPPLVLPATKTKDDSTIVHYFKIGKGYLSFYKTGLKAVYTNFKASRPIQDRADKEGGSTLTGLVEQDKITRAEFQTIMRARHDNRRIPIFALLFVVCGEFTPFVVVLFSDIVPYTCRIPSQILEDRQQVERRRHNSLKNSPPTPSTSDTPQTLTRNQLLHISSSLGLHSRKWHSLLPATPFTPPTPLIRHKIKKHLEYVNLDDTLLEKLGGVDAIAKHATASAVAGSKVEAVNSEDAREREAWRRRQELEMIASDRAIDTLDRSEDEILKDLKRWFSLRSENVLKAF
ncbi:hypothetical protein DFH27DRAFT_571089, partial [Peziza echinospora]